MKKHETVENYLSEVSRYLEPLSDKDQVVKELRAHIWDQASQISERNPKISITEAFDQATLMMEDPQILAENFLEEESSDSRIEWKKPLRAPEAKLQNEQFIVLAIIGFGAVLAMSWIIQILSNNLLVSGVSVVIGLLAMGVLILGLYQSDERLFREQIEKFRELFQKPQSSDYLIQKAEFVSEKSVVTKEAGFWSAFGEHLGGFFGGIFIGFLIIFLFFNELTQWIPLYNNNWYIGAGLVVYFSLAVGLIKSIWLVAFGRIRYTRLMSAVANFVGGICAVVIVIYFPF
ncbi:MAG: hypothetical protein ACXAC8_04205, partial [Candidatus Hodarchaeales archaeon]